MQISASALFSRAARLPRSEIARPPRAIGRNTVHSMQSGIVFGYVGLVDGLVRRLASEMGEEVSVIANPRCVPPWEPDDMWAKVENAANYASAHVGRVDPATVFNGISIEPPPSLFTQASAGFGNARFATEMPPRPWMIDRLMMLHETTLARRR